MKALRRVVRWQGVIMGVAMLLQAALNADAIATEANTTARYFETAIGGANIFNIVLVGTGILSIVMSLRKRLPIRWELVALSLPLFAYISSYLWFAGSPGGIKASAAVYLAYYADKIVLLSLTHKEINDATAE